MSVRKKHIIRHYTIVEVMVAMGIFLVMMTIMMQFFTSAQKVWNLASKKNMMYADARVAMNLMTRELQSMLYNNDLNTGIYPFWYEWSDFDKDKPLLIGIHANAERTTELATYLKTEEKLLYLTQLNFISTTDLKAVEEGSDVCEIRYRFIPVYFKTNVHTMSNVRGGYLQRSCVSEYFNKISGSGTDLTNAIDAGAPYNYMNIPYLGASTVLTRVIDIWNKDTTPEEKVVTIIPNAKFQTVISGVYSLRFTCFAWSSGLKSLDAMDSSGNMKGTGAVTGYDRVTGTPKPVAVRIDMKLMNPKDFKKLAYNIYIYKKTSSSTSEKNAAQKQIKSLKQTMRTFSKVIYLGKN